MAAGFFLGVAPRNPASRLALRRQLHIFPIVLVMRRSDAACCYWFGFGFRLFLRYCGRALARVIDMGIKYSDPFI